MKEHFLNLDKPRKLKFGFRADMLLDEKYKGKEFEDLEKRKLHEFPFYAYAGLIWEDETLTPEKTLQMLDEKIGVEYSKLDIINIIMEAMTDHMGIKLKKKAKTATRTTVKSRSK